jgi:hypothetical protein
MPETALFAEDCRYIILVLVRFQVLSAASMMFRIVFWDVLPCQMIVDNHFTWQYIPEDNSEHRSCTYLLVTIELLHPLFVKIWRTGMVPNDWKKGLLVKLPKKGDVTNCKIGEG